MDFQFVLNHSWSLTVTVILLSTIGLVCMATASLLAALAFTKWVNHKIRLEGGVTFVSPAPAKTESSIPHVEFEKRFGPRALK